MRALAAVLIIGLVSSCLVAQGPAQSYDDETWDSASATNNKWAYWDTSYGTFPHHHHPMDWFGGGGSGGTGHVSAPLAEMDAAPIHTVSAYWAAYPGEDMETIGFPYIDLRIAAAAISVEIKGAHSPTTPPVDLGGGQVRFFIGYYDTKNTPDPNDDKQAFFCTKGTFDVGNNLWDETTVVLGGDNDWHTIVKDEDLGKDTMPTDLYDGPQQWGFTIYPVPLGSIPSGGTLGFDEFHLVPEPTTLALMGLGCLLARKRRRA